MNKKVKIQFGQVQETLLLPLWGRAVESKKTNPLLIDEKAAEILEKIDYDFSVITQNMNELSQMGWIARSLKIDRIVADFLKEHPEGTVVNIGCGMDTTFDRIDNGKVMFYELDMPDVIELRKKFFNETERHKTIASSFLDKEWIRSIEVKDGLMCISGGVFYYFDEQQIKNFFNEMGKAFTVCEFVFDFLSPLGIKVGNKKVLEAGGMNVDTTGKSWGIKKAAELENWDSRIKVLKDIPMYKGLKRKFPVKLMLGACFPDFLKVASIVHMRIENK